MKPLITIFTLLITFLSIAQTTITGKVTDPKGIAIEGANVYLKGTYDGTSTNEKGEFSFETHEIGKQTLVVSFISFETFFKSNDVSQLSNLKIKLKEDVNTLDAVLINAGSFEAGDNAKVTALKPLDVVTTASALGDVIGAFQTLPGTSANDDDGRLFVRGGDAEETQIFVDGLRVFTPYSPTANNIPTRGRFSPFLFKGMTFSTGGYSAEYGQALSGVLTLNTIDQPDQEKTEIQLMTVGAGIGNTQIWGKNSFSINTSYINLAPYLWAYSDRNTWNKPFEGFSGEMVYRYKPNDDALLKLYGAYSGTRFDVIQQDINFNNGFRFGLQNHNMYVNGSYSQQLNDNWNVSGGFSFTHDNSDINLQQDIVDNQENALHAKIKLKKHFSNRFKLSFGAELFSRVFEEIYESNQGSLYKNQFTNNLLATFAESDVYFSKKLAAKLGVRVEKNSLLNQFTFSPRVSLAYKSGKNSQFSMAYGQFYQDPKNDYIKFDSNLQSENAQHYILNYQFVKNKQILRVEGYYKSYDDLVKYSGDFAGATSNYNNSGNGYAKGVDVFWRDSKNIKNLDYWVSYSLLDTKRDYRNFSSEATPNFASKHNISLVGKYWIDAWKTQLGFSYTFASGRSYTNPNKNGFLNQQTKNYNSLSLNAAYLISPQKILYFSVNNVLGTQNVFGYNYKNEANADGVYERQAIVPNADRFFFVGFFWSISKDKKSNQLNNL
ncbi:TonB-dependent receptor [Tenacibaculum geojense]|uniref:TonB-dependent receptor domain-containing protein n=1 Tax=Tenacibaculum geojense TaxID=915352 RepID=A0ABW3JRE2_9FLAO